MRKTLSAVIVIVCLVAALHLVQCEKTILDKTLSSSHAVYTHDQLHWVAPRLIRRSLLSKKIPVFFESAGGKEPNSVALSSDPSYRFLNDCIKKRSSIPFTTWCKGQTVSSDVFIAEKFNLDGEDYWCFNFEVDKLSQTKKVLSIKSKDQYKLFSWLPSEAVNTHDRRNSPTQNIFHIGTKRTTIEFSAYKSDSPTPEIEEISLDGQDICKYYKAEPSERVTTAAPQVNVNEIIRNEKRAPILTSDPAFRYLNDCLDKRASVSVTTHCKTARIPSDMFLIERFVLNGDDYWCFNFEPLPKVSSKQQRHSLSMSFNGSSICPIAWLPADASTSDRRNSASTSVFNIGQKRTTIAVGPEEDNTGIPDLADITVGGQDVCQFYKQYAQTAAQDPPKLASDLLPPLN